MTKKTHVPKMTAKNQDKQEKNSVSEMGFVYAG